jgi:hypothetical protein
MNTADFNTTGNADIDALRHAMRSQFQLGSSDLSNAAIQNDAARMFQEMIAAAGGSQNLRAEIGDARFINRLQEFLGKGSTLDQSGVINIGNGQTINSLRDLADFGQPVQGGAEAPAGVAGGGLAGLLAGGGGGGGGAGSFSSVGGGSAPAQSGFLGFLEQQLMDRIGGGFGVSAENQAAQQAALQSGFNRNLSSSLSGLEAQLNAAGALGGGRHAVLGQELTQGLTESFLNQLASQQMGFNQLELQDRQAAFGEGGNFANTRVNQQLGLGDINARNRATSAQLQLGQMDDATRRLLGIGGLNEQAAGRLQQGSQFDRSFGLQQQGQQFNQGLQTFGLNADLLGLR